MILHLYKFYIEIHILQNLYLFCQEVITEFKDSMKLDMRLGCHLVALL